MKLSRRLPLNALRVFEVVARLGNFTRAAEELGMTQTAVSYQIKLLEEYLGTLVFIRKPRALQLTDAGKKLLPKVAEAFSLLSEAMRLARGDAEETLEIYSPPTFASHWLSGHLESFQRDHPHITIRLTRYMCNSDVRDFPNDIAIHIAPEPPDDLVSHQILKIDYTPMLHPRLAESIGGVHVPADLLKLPWISEAKSLWTGWFDSIGLDHRKIKHANLDTFGALDLQANAAIAGHGVAMLPPFFFGDELPAGRLVQPFDLCVGDGNAYWLCYSPARRNSGKIKAFTGWLQSALAQDARTILH